MKHKTEKLRKKVNEIFNNVCSAYENKTGCLIKSLTTLKAYINLFNGQEE
jgi:hypothetical protein